MKMDMSQYLDVFLDESKEHLGNLNQKLLDLEKNPQDIPALNEIFRAAHTLKGMSSTMGFISLADLTHHMENVLVDLKEGILKVNSHVVDILFQCFDNLQLMIEQIEAGQVPQADNKDLISKLENIKSGTNNESPSKEKQKPGEKAVFKEEKIQGLDTSFEFNDYDLTVFQEAASRDFLVYYIKIGVSPECLMKAVRAFMVYKAIEEDDEIIKSIPSTQDLDDGKFDSGFELFVISKNSKENILEKINKISEIEVLDIQNIDVDLLKVSQADTNNKVETEEEMGNQDIAVKKAPKLKQTVRVDIDRLDNLMNLVGELVMHKGRLEQIGANQKINELDDTIEQIDRISTDLQSVVMKVRMVPIEQVFNRFPRMVRDLAKDLKKEVDFIIEGKETELDRTVIDEIGDPLVHLLRNSIDHGIETSQEREQKGKDRQGTVILKARHEGNNVYIEVEDDGGGIHHNKIIEKAIEKNLITAKDAEQLSREEATDLLFLPGFSTASNVTDVSGRGVGLDVVKNKIESLNGEIYIDSTPGKGTKFRIKLPLTLAIIQALMVAVQEEIYAIPLSSVDETTMITKEDIKMIQNQEVIMLRGNVLPLFRLTELLEVSGETNDEGDMYVVVVRKADRQIGLVLDTLIGQQEIVIKSLGRLLAGIPGIAGAIVAGDGNVRLILDITTLF